ncbi:hypothetical protein [Arthrobacter crystallopoietes]|uniref:Uncharacterized protein n=1 Tax=Crystallibacter crystallopoietes TaxID=37928 RepID=A0A1H1CVF5_9MICC|nr:hypothetical protein [Arthrobacter crystallopoietes]AUI50609.1 hypothetical protein AC20117_06985 [Arthrobacter crystallopoietes]SDQ67556.1 hypothetical protein SAMN04489742_2083 [Arthrobacter crystallopoietes]
MKKPITWRLLILVVGTLLGLLAGAGLSAPATAAPAVSASSTYDKSDAELDLKLNKNGKFKVVGEDFEAKKVHVMVVKINKHKDKVIAHKIVRTDDGEFKWIGKKLRCGDTYKAFAHSKKDGWVESDKLRVKCRDGKY